MGQLQMFVVSLSESRPQSGGEVEVEGQEDTDTGIRLQDEEDPPAALAPDVSPQEEQTSATTHGSPTPDFVCLDETLSLGKISQTKVAELKSSYSLLHDAVKSSRAAERRLLGEAQRRRAELERLRGALQRTEERGAAEEEEEEEEQPQSEVNQLRQQLLQAYNELKAAEDREYETQHKLNRLREEKLYLEKESEAQTRAAESESRAKALRDKYEDLRKEVSQRQMEASGLMEDVETHERQILKDEQELEEQKEVIELKEAEKARLIGTPGQIFREIERERSKKEAATKDMSALNEEFSEKQRQVAEAERLGGGSPVEQKEQLEEEQRGLRARLEDGQTRARRLLQDLERNREEEARLTGDRGILEMKLQSVLCDRKHLHESQAVQLREKNRQMQALKRMERALTTASEQLRHTESIHHQLQAQLDAIPKREASAVRRMALQKEVDALKESFEKQRSLAEDWSQEDQRGGATAGLLRESNRLREELHNLGCLTRIKAEERGQKHRELLRAQQLNQNILLELREKDLILMDHNKLNAMLQRRVSQYCKLCHMMTEEKNKYIQLKQMASQTTTELTEQLKLLENEMQIQHSIVINKDRLLTKARMKISISCKMRDRLRNDISKIAWKQRQISQASDDCNLELIRLNHTMNLQEQALLEINKNHEVAIQRRNCLGIELLEHEEVLSHCYQKMSVQGAAIAKGHVVLETLEKETGDLRLEVSEERRQTGLKKRELPLAKRLQGEITVLQIELSEARDKTIEALNRTVDCVELKGKDPETVELVKKIEQLEMNLAESERRVVEKELLADQVTRLTEPLREQADRCQQDRLSLAKKLNELRSDIMDTNERMMAVSAELSMKQAAAFSLRQEIKERELQMDRCREQQEQGLPPCPEIEEEWRRMLRDKKRRLRDKVEKARLAEQEEWNELPNGEYTTAETRPNAYIPQSGCLPLPKPYGALAPFKPSPPGATMRHIRKPSLKPLQF